MGRFRGDEIAERNSIRRVAFASFIGTAVEWYDFFVYGTAAALVFPKLFFPHFSPVAGTLASFATFGVAFFARPIGGIVFGHFSDRVGRKSMLVVTLPLMGGATFLIGVLPTFEQVVSTTPGSRGTSKPKVPRGPSLTKSSRSQATICGIRRSISYQRMASLRPLQPSVQEETPPHSP